MGSNEVKNLKILRAEEEWQRAGAYSVRIEGMNRQHHISLRDEFDEYDCDGTKYIVLLDDEYPFGTCRFHEIDEERVSIGRVVILEPYRGGEYGRLVMEEAEKWIQELGYREILVDSRTVAVGFYEKLGYTKMDDKVIICGPFECIQMHKVLE